MNRDELSRYKGVTGFNLGQVEKDYLQHIVLGAISRNLSGAVVFKGGTALQKLGITRRFSEDLDFTAREDIPISRLRAMTSAVLSVYNYPVEYDTIRDDERTVGFRMMIHGPLHRDAQSLCSLRIEISRRESVLLPPSRTEMAPLYTDVMPYVLSIMHLDEMTAEKIRAILTRTKARDLYDLYYLARQNVTVTTDLIRDKLAYYGVDFHPAQFLVRCEGFQRRWDTEMGSLVGSPPPFHRILDGIRAFVGTRCRNISDDPRT